MPTERLTIRQWRERIDESPARVVEQFLGKLELTTHETRRALFAAIPDEKRLLEELQFAASDETAPLRAAPYMLQDLFDVRRLPTACGAPFKEPFEAPLESSSLLYQQLKRLGAAFLGKTVPAEFGVDLQGRNRTYGDCPHSTGSHKVGGGGAGPSVRAVADGWVPLAFGLDTTGGVRIPSAFHGLFTYRMPTNDYARDGVFPIVPSIESIGCCTHHPEDLRTVFDAFHPSLSDKAPSPPRGYLLADNSELQSPEIKSALLHLARNLDVDEGPEPHAMLSRLLDEAEPTLALLQARELYAVHQYWIEEYHERYDPELLRLIEEGQSCRPGEADACDHARGRIRAELMRFFQNYDFLMLPVCPLPSPQRRKWSPALEREIRRLTAPASLAQLPVLTLPFRCATGDFGAAQIWFHPQRIGIVPLLLNQVADYYADYRPD